VVVSELPSFGGVGGGFLIYMKRFRTETEMQVGATIGNIFERNPDSTEIKLENFPKYVRRQHLKRFLTLYEIYKRLLPIKGSIVECGVFRGFSLMTWAKLSAIMEPENLIRRVYGFDTYEGFPSLHDKDKNADYNHEVGHFFTDAHEELTELVDAFDRDRFLGHINKVQLIKGDCTKTIPTFIEQNPHLLVSMLFIDLDLYEPTKVALEHFLPRMHKGSIIAFDELDNPQWPGETLALLESYNIKNLTIESIPGDPYIGFAVLG
jgi:Macrocin-O-methyltransferase (TylF)